MTIEPERSPDGPRSVLHAVFGVGGGIASTVFGTIVVMATLALAYAAEKQAWELAGIVVSTAFLFWLSHLYAHGLSESIERGRRLTGTEWTGIARRELGILLAAALPVSVLVLGALGLFARATSVWLALAIALATLAAEGVRYARLEGLGFGGTLAAVVVNLALGTLVVALKVALVH